MPTFSAIALDRLLEPGGSRPVDRSAPSSMPLPNSQNGRNANAPSPFPPSPIINHKRRTPRLLKSTSEASILAERNVLHDCEKPFGKSSDMVILLKEQGDSVYHFEFDSSKNGDFGTGHRESGSSSITNDLQVPTMNSQRGLEIEDFFDPNESMSFASITDVEDNAAQNCL
ncbi:uncharacterized protein LOC107633018 [Arachis ipaensis]|uniref:uncharacterized protein LOC107633018 n=1 Tax=Arachis ipaensis TaxID=130454 RepID=UPI0007AF070D|nr:uncharacterized protein LOC107633018 [Arachis ipaensis]